MALFVANFQQGKNIDNVGQLVDIAHTIGLNADQTRQQLQGSHFGSDIRTQEAEAKDAGIKAVPAMIVDECRLVAGAQDARGYTEIIRGIVAAR